ncbi:MAG: hypothetical protein PHI85_01840 [Victivallaceae bacterium]|nr:hypothetical protein [Victivallaceae bacterium]
MNNAGRFLRAVAVAAALLVAAAGCASSERMTRITDSYKVPHSSRLSGARWDRGDDNGFTGTQINVWPLFARSNNYYSALWPMFDCDRYGMAVRPFFNQEGDEYAVLFPLCAWNPVNGDGWALNTYWNKTRFGCFPLFHSGSEIDWVFPGVFWNKYTGLGGVLPALTFWGRDDDRDRWFVSPLGGGMFSGNPEKNWWMALNTYGDSDNFGCFPLFHSGPKLNYVPPGIFWLKDNRGGLVLPALTFWDNKAITSLPLMTQYQWDGDFFSLPLLTLYENKKFFSLPLLTFAGKTNRSDWFWTPLAGGTTHATKPEYAWWSALNFYRIDTGFGLIPLFAWNDDGEDRILWILPFLINSSRSAEIYNNSFRFLFLPLWGERRKPVFESGDSLEVLDWAWQSEAGRKNASAMAGYTGDVNDRTALTRFLREKYPESVTMAESSTYGFPLLFECKFAGEYDQGPSPFGLLFSYKTTSGTVREFTFLTQMFFESSKSSYHERLSMLLSLVKISRHSTVRPKFDPADNALSLAESRLMHLTINAEAPDNDISLNKHLADARDCGIDLPENPDWKTVRAARLEYQRDHRPDDTPPPLDYQEWRVFWLLASGESTPEWADGQVLWQLWNYKRRGSRSRTRIFPFITIREESGECEYSWIWNKFISVKSDAEDRLSGRILFIPW